jgi:hypothetical protein
MKATTAKASEAVLTARAVLKDTLRRGTVSLDEIGRRLGHARGYMSRAFRGINPLTIETIIEALVAAGLRPADYFAALAKALAPAEADEDRLTQAKVEEIVLRTLRRFGWLGLPFDDERDSRPPRR